MKGKNTQGEHKSTFDELIDLTKNYRNSANYFEFIKFVSRIKNYSAYNTALIYAQNPKVTYVASKTDWAKRHNRTVKPEARPLIILAPFHPVLFVFDVNDTEGEPLPERVFSPFWAEGEVPEKGLFHLKRLCKKLDIKVVDNVDTNTSAGSIRANYANGKFESYTIQLNQNHTNQVKFATFVHEIAHLLCGHLGKHKEEEKWHSRTGLSIQQQEFEAESISYIVCKRFGVRSNSEEYLSGYTQSTDEIPPISIDTVLHVSAMLENAILDKTSKRQDKETTHDLTDKAEQLSLL